MAGYPSAGELVAAVREFLGALALTGRDAFHARVAANALAIVERELGAPPHAPVLGLDESDLCRAIRADTLSTTTPGLLDALIVATCARLAVDNPRYPTLARLAPDAAPPR